MAPSRPTRSTASRGVGPDQLGQTGQLHAQAGQGRSDLVVQITSEPCSLILPPGHELLTARPQLVRELDRSNGPGAVVDELGHGLVVTLPEPTRSGQG